MKKLLSITFSAVLIVSVAAIAFVSCKKETKGIVYDTYQISEKTEAQLVYENIVKFREARKAYHSNAKAENGYVSPSEARSILDGAINYEFSNMNRYLKDTKLDTLRYTAPTTNAEGNVSVNDLIDIYDMFVSDMGNETNTANYFMIQYPQNNTRDSDVEIVFTRGSDNPSQPVIPDLDYFEVGENWIWGNGGGRCDIPGYDSDAAQELTHKCRAMLYPNRTKDTIDPNLPNIYDVDYAEIKFDSLQSIMNGVDYWLFHAENVIDDDVPSYCITYNYLNIYLQNLYYAIIRRQGCFHFSSRYNSPIRDVCIGDPSQYDHSNNGHGYYHIAHLASLTYYKIGIPH